MNIVVGQNPVFLKERLIEGYYRHIQTMAFI